MRFSGRLLAAALCFGFDSASAADLIVNGGFEEAVATAGWETNIYGATPRMERDPITFHGGSFSLRIDAQEPSDTALAQEVRLDPKRWFRFSAWVKTKDLDPRGSAVSAALQVQRTKGAGLIAGGPSYLQNTDWTNSSVYFQTPPDGRARLCLFFVGFGKGTGTVWFDDVRVEQVEVDQAPIRITDQPLVNAQIDPMQYGQFVEYLCDLVPSMWAEKVYDGSFEGLSPYKFAFIKQTDFKEKPWYPSGAVNRGRYSLDKESKVSGNVSQKIETEGVEPCTLGLSQDGIFIDRGKACDFRCWLRTEGFDGPVRVRLHHDGKIYASAELKTTQQWQKFETILVPNARDTATTISVEFRGPGKLWIDNVSLMPRETVGGWRPDVVEAVRALKPGVIRFGGSALDEPGFGEFEWKDTIGDPNRRKPFRAWGGLQPAGPGLEEFVQFCQSVNAEQLICVRFANRAPADAAQEVEYFNGATNTPMGLLRTRNGHAAPYRVRFWQVGNERQSREYDQQLGAFCNAMRTVDPTIRVLSSFPTADSIRDGAACIDYVCPHHYTPNLRECESNLAFLRKLIAENAPDRNIKVAVTEWNTTAGDWGLGRAMLMTLDNALACSRYHNLLHRNCDLVEIANRSNLINSLGSGIIQANNHRLYKTPTYFAQLLYANLAGTQPLSVESILPANVGLDLSATLDPRKSAAVLFAVNQSLADVTRPLDFSAFGGRKQRLKVWTLADRDHAGERDVRNSFDDPERVGIRESSLRVDSSRFNYRFPALSLTVIEYPTHQ